MALVFILSFVTGLVPHSLLGINQLVHCPGVLCTSPAHPRSPFWLTHPLKKRRNILNKLNPFKENRKLYDSYIPVPLFLPCPIQAQVEILPPLLFMLLILRISIIYRFAYWMRGPQFQENRKNHYLETKTYLWIIQLPLNQQNNPTFINPNLCQCK